MIHVFRLLKMIGRYKGYTLLGIFFHILTAVCTVISIPLVIPFFQILFGASPSDYPPPDSWMDLEVLLNYYFSRLIAISDHFIALQVVCLTVLFVFFLKNLFRFLNSYFMVYVRNALLMDKRKEIWASYEAMSLSRRNEFKKGHLLSLISNDLAEVDRCVLTTLEFLFRTPLIILGSLVLMIWLSPKLTLIAFGLILFTLLFVGRISHVLKRQAGRAQELLSRIHILADRYLSSLKIIRIHHSSGHLRNQFNALNNEHFALSNKMLRRRDLASPLAEFLGVATIVALLYFGTYEVFAGSLQPGTFFAFVFAFYNVIDPAKTFSREYANVQRGIAALIRIDEFHSSIPVRALHSLGSDLIEFKAELAFQNVSFTYSDDQSPILNRLNFQLQKGERVGLTGLSGAGKTTILDIILKFYPPSEGQVLIDGTELKELNTIQYRSIFGLITQAPLLFHGSVQQNIIVDKDLDSSKLSHVLDLVGLDGDFLSKTVGDDLARISGGEAQRICLARALYRRPKILIMDEPTSQLDLVSRKSLIERITFLPRDFSLLVVTHQRELLEKMDRILVLNNGQIQDHGQYEDLLHRNDLFKSLLG